MSAAAASGASSSQRHGGTLASMADAATLRQNVEDVLVRLLAGGETDLAERLVHPDFVNHEAAADRRHGPQGAAATSEWLRSCFGDLRYEIHHIFVDGEMTAAYVTMSGTHEGGLPPGLPATHKPFAVKHVHLIRFADDGRAIEHSAVRDDLGMVVQLGLLPPPSPQGPNASAAP